MLEAYAVFPDLYRGHDITVTQIGTDEFVVTMPVGLTDTEARGLTSLAVDLAKNLPEKYWQYRLTNPE